MNSIQKEHRLNPTDEVNGYKIRPGYYLLNGAEVVRGGVNFTIHSFNATSCTLLLFRRQENTPYVEIPFPEGYRIGHTYSMIVFGLDITEFEYAYSFDGPYEPSKGLIFNKDKYLLDPYAKAVTGQSAWGNRPCDECSYKGRVVDNAYDWGNFKQPELPFEDLVIYEMHVRGFTMDESSGVANRGTFEGIREKIPYLIKLGINAVELMPIFEFDEMEDSRTVNGERLYNYWGYNPVCFFAPNTSYTSAVEYNREGTELKNLIKDLNSNGIEVILDVVFNHTAEGNEKGPFFSFKGIDNNIYYMLTPGGYYYNFSGCGNVFNCNHPIVQQFIVDCLRYWVTEYRVDGFRFDLASILGRNEDGAPMSMPPLLKSLAFDPILGKTKLIAEAWDAGGLYQVGSFPSWRRWAEWNGRYRDDIRCFLKSDSAAAGAGIARITGSKDIYNPEFRGENASVNFLTCHDGFTLYDMYSYSVKHNEKNGWNNTDGANDNNSWNCGCEGETTDTDIMYLRRKLCKNAFAVLMCSRGPAMFCAGDEFCNTQYGNNNSYCQDNIISWLDWNRLEEFKDVYEFAEQMIEFRKNHLVIRKKMKAAECGVPEISIHNGKPWNDKCVDDTRQIGIMYAGRNEADTDDDIVFIAVNTYWEKTEVSIPVIDNRSWSIYAFTGERDTVQIADDKLMIEERSAVILISNK